MIERIIFLLLITNALAADHDNFKDCSRVDFCTRLRNTIPNDDSVYNADLGSLNIDNNFAKINLNNAGGNNLKLEINALSDGRFRVRIEEESSTRYRLQDVLDGEPEIKNIVSFNQDENSVTLAENENSDSKIVVRSSPLSIELYKNGVLEIVVGNRLIMENSDTSKAFAVGVAFPDASEVYGAHQHAENLALQNTGPNVMDPYRFRNSDNGYYDMNSPMALYGAIPVLYGTGTSTTSGIFLLNAAELWIEITRNNDQHPQTYLIAETGSLDLFLLPGPTQAEVVRQYIHLTGLPHLPQLWTLGFHQSRYSYLSQEDVKEVIANMDNNNFPMDVIWLDIDYTDGMRYFTWNPSTFNNPIEMQNNISSTNRKLVTIIDPHVKIDEDYSVYKEARDRDFFIKRSTGENYDASCWPGNSNWLDFLNSDARDFYASRFSYENFGGSTETLAGIWNDMNEPAVFDNDNEKTVSFDSVHTGGIEHSNIHNIYGFLQTMGTHKGLLDRDNGQKRPFILTRAHFAGSQRYAAIWTGDNGAERTFLQTSFPMCVTSNMVGLAFCGADVGGFNNNPSEELLQRWFQAGAWLPFFRSHTSADRREPYLYNEEVQKVLRGALETRYKHIPVWYTLFFEHIRTGDPIVRPLSYHYSNDQNVYRISDQLLLGSDILVRNIFNLDEQQVSVYFPGENDYWYQLDNSQTVYKGAGYQEIQIDISFIPVYYRSGSIIPRKDTVRRSTTDAINDGYTLYVNLDENNQASGRLYIDDYTSFNYRDNSDYTYANLNWNGSDVEITFIDSDATNNFEIKIDSIVVNKLSQKGGNGSYTQTVLKKSATGQLLSEIRFDRNKTVSFKL